jgi:hypothetical protein
MVAPRRFDLGWKPDARPAGAFPSTNPAADRFIGGRTPGVGGTERGSCLTLLVLDRPATPGALRGLWTGSLGSVAHRDSFVGSHNGVKRVALRQQGDERSILRHSQAPRPLCPQAMASPAKHVSTTNGAPGQSPCAETADQGCRQFEAPPRYQSTRFPLRTRSEIATHPGAHFERTRCGWRFNSPQVGGPLWVSPKSTTRAQAHPRVQHPLSPLSARSSADADNQRMVTVGPLIEPKPCVNVPSPSRGAWACDNKVRRGPRRRHLPLSLRLSPQRRDQ